MNFFFNKNYSKMGFSMDKVYGFLLLKELNTFAYCCSKCPSEFNKGNDLEKHILLEHRENMRNIEHVSVNDDIADEVDTVATTSSEEFPTEGITLKSEIEIHDTIIQKIENSTELGDDSSSSSSSFLGFGDDSNNGSCDMLEPMAITGINQKPKNNRMGKESKLNDYESTDYPIKIIIIDEIF